MPEQTVRAFVAVELPDKIRGLLETHQSELLGTMGSAASGIRWTRPESVHVTLQFLGDVPTAQVPEIGTALQDACRAARPMKLVVSGVGAFPNLRRPRVVWIGLEGDIDRLRVLASAIGQRLSPLGYKPDKPFEPHITLGRVRDGVRPDDIRAISQALSASAAHRMAGTSFDVTSLSLMQSHLQPGGSVYTRLANEVFGP